MALLSLVAIFKDEALSVRALLESAKPYVDAWCIYDTGSTDGTQAIIREVMADLPGALHEGPFVDFATARNRALDLDEEHSGCEFSFFLSGDEVLEGGDDLRKQLEAKRHDDDGAYCIEMRSGSIAWKYPRVLRTATRWRYVGAVHEVPRSPDGGKTSGPLLPGVRVVHNIADMKKRNRRMREIDIPLLTKEVNDESKAIEDRGQAIWHLGFTYEAVADEHQRSKGGPWLTEKMLAMSYYRRYVEISNDDAKTAWAAFRYLNVAEAISFYRPAELLDRLEPLAALAPKLPEIRYSIAVHAAMIDARRGLYLAEEAARVAAEVRDQPIHVPIDARTEWLALRLAAECARALKKAPTYIQGLVARALRAGGPPAEFNSFLEKAP